ncbi:unnamed protein product [Trichobilharzia regenti]|nr:unnamed protein product [Trichobilharzia regenti]
MLNNHAIQHVRLHPLIYHVSSLDSPCAYQMHCYSLWFAKWDSRTTCPQLLQRPSDRESGSEKRSCNGTIAQLIGEVSFASALFPGAIVACFQLQSCVDMTLTEDIRRLGSLYALNWNPRSRCLHLLTDHGGTAKATIHIAPNGSVNLVTVKKLPNSDQYGSCDFIPPMSWCLDEWMMEINDFSHSDDF